MDGNGTIYSSYSEITQICTLEDKNHGLLDQELKKIAKKSIELRYELLPYIYDLYYISHKEGLPIFRPMIMEYEKDMNLLNMREQFMLGENMIVAPVLYEGERSKTLYLPKGSWFNYFTMEKLQGGKWYKLPCELDEILVFVKEGAIIPTYNKKFRNVKERPNNILLKVLERMLRDSTIMMMDILWNI